MRKIFLVISLLLFLPNIVFAQVNILPQVNPAQLVVGLSFLLQFVFLLVLFGGVGFILIKKNVFAKFPTTALIFRMRGEKMFLIDEDKAKRIKKKDGEIYYEFKKRPGVKWKPPSFEFLSPTTKNKSVMFLKELAQDDFEIIDPKTFISANSESYRLVEHEEIDRFYKNLQDEKARGKWKQEGRWDKLITALPTILSIMFIAIFFYIVGQYVIIPVMNQFGGSVNQAIILNNQSAVLLDKSTSYLDILLRQDHGTQTQYVCPDRTIVNNPNLCFNGNSTP